MELFLGYGVLVGIVKYVLLKFETHLIIASQFWIFAESRLGLYFWFLSLFDPLKYSGCYLIFTCFVLLMCRRFFLKTKTNWKMFVPDIVFWLGW